MAGEIRRILFKEGKISSLCYNTKTLCMTVIYGGGHKSVFAPVSEVLFEQILLPHDVKSVLRELRHGNVVGVRVE